jgi:ribonuclease HI
MDILSLQQQSSAQSQSIIYVYCDGCALGNGQTGAVGGYGVYFPSDETLNISQPYKTTEVISSSLSPATNQKTELLAMQSAINLCLYYYNRPESYPSPYPSQSSVIFHIYSDSMYTINCLNVWMAKWATNGYKKADKKPVKNLSIIKPMYELYQKYRHLFKLIHINSHTGKTDQHSLGNARADQLANDGARK